MTAAVVASLLVVYSLSARNRYLVNDDYQVLYTAWLRSIDRVPGRDFAIYSYHLLVDLLTPLFRAFPDSLAPLYWGRAAMIGALLGISALLYSLGARLYGRSAALVAPVLVLASHAMLYRALDLRPDLLTTLVWLAILRLLMVERLLCHNWLTILGILAGIVFVNRFKAALIFPVIAVVVAQRVYEQASPSACLPRLARALVSVGLGALAAPALYIAWLAGHGELQTYLKTHLALLGTVDTAAALTQSLRRRTLEGALARDSLFWGLAVLGVAARALLARRFSTRTNVLTGCLLLLAIGSVALNPAYYAYNLVTLVPIVALFACYPAALILGRLRGRWSIAAAAAAILLPVFPARGLMWSLATERTNGHQLALSEFFLKYTTSNVAVFGGLEGIGLFRPSVYHWRMPEVLRPRYLGGEMNYASELSHTKPEILVSTYRLSWLLPRDQAYLVDHFVPIAPFIAVHGHSAGGVEPTEEAFELLSSGRYELLVKGGGICKVDALDAAATDTIVELDLGRHVMLTGAGTECTVRRLYPSQALALLANPFRLPYLVAPELGTLPGL